MMDYKRFISYLYTYIEGEKGVNVGYIRCEQRQGSCRLTLSILDHQGIEGGRYKVYLYKADKEGTPVGYYVDDLVINGSCGELRKQTPSENVWNTGGQIEDFDGMIAVYDKMHMYVSKWSEEDIQFSLFLTYKEWKEKTKKETSLELLEGWQEFEERSRENPADTKEEPVKESAADQAAKEAEPTEADEEKGKEKQPEFIAMDKQAEETEQAEETKQAEEVKQEEETKQAEEVKQAEEIKQPEQEQKPETQLQQSALKKNCISEMTIRLMEARPKLPDFENHEIYDCVRIEPNDIGLLEMENWRLGVNSFLTHGYYNYKYLMLGKLRFQDGAVRAVLGVPGVFDNKEQYIAKIFGFDIFVPVKHTNMKTGSFGYWIIELV